MLDELKKMSAGFEKAEILAAYDIYFGTAFLYWVFGERLGELRRSIINEKQSREKGSAPAVKENATHEHRPKEKIPAGDKHLMLNKKTVYRQNQERHAV